MDSLGDTSLLNSEHVDCRADASSSRGSKSLLSGSMFAFAVFSSCGCWSSTCFWDRDTCKVGIKGCDLIGETGGETLGVTLAGGVDAGWPCLDIRIGAGQLKVRCPGEGILLMSALAD